MNNTDLPVSDRVFLQRVHDFFSHGLYNVASAIVGAGIASIVLREAGTSSQTVGLWFASCFISCALVVIIDQRFRVSNIDIHNANRWLLSRFCVGAIVALHFGLTPYLLPASASLHHEMFLFIIVTGMVSLSSSGYTLMPAHYLVLSGFSVLPFVVYFLFTAGYLHDLMLSLAILWPVLVLAKALRVSKAAIHALSINQKLIDEASEHEKTKEQLKRMATHDTLTGLPNRRLLQERLELILAQARRYNRCVCVMFLDLDGFKSINDTYGHRAGDETLRQTADRLRRLSRESDIVARLGGDEFVLVITEISDKVNDPIVFAQRILKTVAEPIVFDNDIRIHVGISIGIALYPDDGLDVDRLMVGADQAMYNAKKDGKNQFATAS